MTVKYRPLSLPRVPITQQVTANLVADPVTPTAYALLATPGGFPSLLRRARFVQGGAQFSYVLPLPISFPYELPKPDASRSDAALLGEQQRRETEAEEGELHALSAEEREAKERASAVRRMDEVEGALREFDVTPPSAPPAARVLDPMTPARRRDSYPSARLVAVSPTTHAACVPHLDIGDAHEWVLRNSGKDGPASYSSGPIADAVFGVCPRSAFLEAPPGDDAAASARRVFSEWAAGRAVRVDAGDEPASQETGPGVAFFHAQEKEDARAMEHIAPVPPIPSTPVPPRGPWALRYGGHQFGEWAGQLGDGRAITLQDTVNPDDGQRWELQLKGAGRTPYSRFGDGLATLKSSLREFLASEYMAALGTPTSRAMCVVCLPDLRVVRETTTPAAIAMRLASSWLRIGSFQIHASRGEWESARILGEYVARELFGWTDVVKGAGGGVRAPWAERLLREVALRNARTCALWQVYGFMHGVLNTDNISLMGDTIDYGPFGFMDVLDDAAVCNHSDTFGRYSYRMQPTMILFAVARLLEAIAPIVGYERIHGAAPAPGVLASASSADLALWTDHAVDALQDEVTEQVKAELLADWSAAWRRRLGLTAARAADKTELIDPLLDVIAGLDMTTTLRALCAFPEASALQQPLREFARTWLAGGAPAAPGLGAALPDVTEERVAAATAWLGTYAERLHAEGRANAETGAQMRTTNPRFVLRNWVTDEAAQRVEDHNDTQFFEKIRVMCADPFFPWGEPRDGADDAEVADEARLCRVGEKLTENPPSCSS
ncbi:hypothetical protein MSPP1_003844 [Malassezia sp. CBS 17886]|nr:hypothetical protein MSPP1_003844 [Malassezia sp. CBS 17886]